MTTDPFDQDEGRNPFARLLSNGLVTAPIGLAGYAAYTNVKSNSVLNPISAVVSAAAAGTHGAHGQRVGNTLRHSGRSRRTKLLRDADNLTSNLLDEDGFRKIWQNMAEQQAVIQSLIDTMDDPSSGIKESVLINYREKLVDLLSDQTSLDEARESIGAIVRSVNEGNDDTVRTNLVNNFRQYKRVGAQLAIPTSTFTTGKTYTEIDASAMSKTAQNRHRTLLDKLGGSGHVETVSFASRGRNQAYARIYDQKKGRFQALLPLDLASDGKHVQLRMNENLTTGYRGNRYMIDYEAGAKLLSAGNATSESILRPISKGGAGIDVEDYIMDRFFNQAKLTDTGSNSRVHLNRNSFAEWTRQFFAADWRVASSGQDFGAFTDHLAGVAGFQHNYAHIVNMPTAKRKQEAFITQLGTTPGFESGIGAARILSRGLNNESFGTVGIYEGSALSHLESPALQHLKDSDPTNIGAMRKLYPMVSRIEQVVGREGMFVGKGPVKTLGRSSMTAGAVARETATGVSLHAGRNIGWSKAVTGATNKAILLDVSGTWSGLKDSGVAYHRGTDYLYTPFTKPVLDPIEMGRAGGLGSEFLNKLGTLSQNEMHHFSADDIKKYSSFLGIGPDKLQFLRQDPRTKGFYLSYSVSENMGKKHINVFGNVKRKMETGKIFSLLHKGNLQEMSALAESHMVGKDVLKRLRNIGLRSEDTIYASGDMLGKGPGFLDSQISTGIELVAGDKGAEIYKANVGKLGSRGAAVRALAGSGVAGYEAGMVLAGTYHLGESKEELEELVTGAFGNRSKAVITAMRAGKALGATSGVAGTGVGDYGLGRGSVEPRFFSNLMHRLHRMGLNEKDTSDYIASIYKNKIGYAEHLSASEGMMSMLETITGRHGPVDALRDIGSELTTYGVNDLVDLDLKNFGKLMAEHEGGFWIDFNKGVSGSGQRQVSAAGNAVFGQGQVFIPGRSVLEAMKGTAIKTTKETVNIPDRYSRMVKNFLENISTASANLKNPYGDAEASMKIFKEEAIRLGSQVVHSVAGGKVKGMNAGVAHMYDLTSGVGFDSKSSRLLALGLFEKTHGRAVFMDGQYFLTQLNDFMGGDLSADEAARKAERFFTTLEGPQGPSAIDNLVARAQSIRGVAGRHPMLSMGNVQITEAFRHVDELGNKDRVFNQFMRSSAGKDLLENNAAFEKITSFDQLGNQNKGLRKQFWSSFTSSIGDWAGEGGGRFFTPRMLRDFEYTGAGGKKTVGVDLGISGAAGGDWDGDQWYSMMASEDASKLLGKSLNDKNLRTGYEFADKEYKLRSAIYTQEARGGLNALKEGAPAIGDMEQIRLHIMAESESKAAVGGLDVRFNKIRTALTDIATDTNGSQVDDALAMLKVVQEHAVLKGKKLPVFKRFAAMLSASVDSAFSQDGSTSELEEVLRTQVFRGSDLLNEGGITGSGLASGKMSLGDTIAFMQEAINKAKISGVADTPSVGQLMAAFDSSNKDRIDRAFNAHFGAKTIQGGMTGGDSLKVFGANLSNTFSKLQSSMSKMDRKTGSIIAMGAMTAMGVAGAIGGVGYSADPMVAPGEVVSPGTRSAIADGTALQSSDHHIPPGNMGPRHDGYSMASKPMNPGTTYMGAQNAYQIRGEIGSPTGMRSFVSAMNGGGGLQAQGSVRVNDARRPITSNYIDRLMGEY